VRGDLHRTPKARSPHTYRHGAVLATGGLGHVYKETTNPSVACGDGMAMAYRAGAILSDMEFVAVSSHGAVRERSASISTFGSNCAAKGHFFATCCWNALCRVTMMRRELAPRDVVARAIVMEMHKTRAEFVYLDLTASPRTRQETLPPDLFHLLLYKHRHRNRPCSHSPRSPLLHGRRGDGPAGGHIASGLFAAGEVAATGVHGANRLASNSLLEGLVFGARSATAMLNNHVPPPFPSPKPKSPAENAVPIATAPTATLPSDPQKAVEEARSILWEKVGIIRDGKQLAAAVKRLSELALAVAPELSRSSYEACNILTVAPLIARCALAREESRGAHYRSDFPLKNETKSPRHSYITKVFPPFFV